MIGKEVHVLMAIVFVVTSVLFFYGLKIGLISVRYSALYMGWIVYFGIYLLVVFLDKKHEEKVMKEMKK